MLMVFAFLGLPVKHRLAGQAYILFSFLTGEFIDENGPSRRPPILYQQGVPG